MADLNDDRAVVAFVNSPAFARSPARSRSVRVSVRNLNALYADGNAEALATIRRVAAREAHATRGAERDHFGKLIWLCDRLLWHLTTREGVAASDRQKLRARPLAERLAAARQALGLSAPKPDAVAASLPSERFGPQGPDLTMRVPSRVPPRQPVRVSREHARQVRDQMTGETARQTARSAARSLRASMTGTGGQEDARSAARAVSAALRGEDDADVRERAQQLRQTLRRGGR